MENMLKAFEKALLSTDRVNASRILSGAMETGPNDLAIETLVVPALENIGAGWESGNYSLSQVYMSGRICEELVETLLPSGNVSGKGSSRMAIALLSDHHALGKRIVYANLRAAGVDLADYGRMGPEALVERIMNDDLQIVLLSVLMLPSAWQVKDVKEKLDASGSTVKIVVGGAPFRLDQQLWKRVGADAVGYTASDAIGIVRSIVKGG
jgi:methanogenic corrinoid protein MtbC1